MLKNFRLRNRAKLNTAIASVQLSERIIYAFMSFVQNTRTLDDFQKASISGRTKWPFFNLIFPWKEVHHNQTVRSKPSNLG